MPNRTYVNLLEETSASVGTGNVVVANAAIPYRRKAADVLADADAVELMIVNSNGEFEHGIYEWDEPTLAFIRGGAQTLLDSSNGGLAVNFSAGTKKVYSGSGQATERLATRHNLEAVADPAGTDNAGDGFNFGSIWNYLGQIFMLGQFSGGITALWYRLLSFHSESSFPYVNARCAYRDYANAMYGWNGHSYSALADENNTFPGQYLFADGAHAAVGALTADATPTKLGFHGDWATYFSIYVEGFGANTIIGTLTAMDKATGDCASWKVEAVATGAADGTVTVKAQTFTILFDEGTLNGGVLAAAFVNGAAGDFDLALQVTGLAATNIIWSFQYQLSAVAAF